MSAEHSTFSVTVSEELRDKVREIEIGGSDYMRDSEQKRFDSKSGFLAEEVVADLFDEYDIDYEQRGGKGEADFVLPKDKTLDVKCRRSFTGYRRLVKNKDLTTSDDTDLYLLTVAHQSKSGDIMFVEVVGWLTNDSVEELGEVCHMHGGNDNCEKLEVFESDLKAPFDLLNLYSEN